jgi:hypothetical protein
MEVLPSPGAVNKTVELVTARWRWRASRRSWTRTKLGYGERFRHFVQDCPGAFRSLTKLARPAEPCGSTTRPKVNNLVHSCHALQHLSLSSCGGLCPKAFLLVLAMDDDDRAASSSAPHADAPQSRLRTLVCQCSASWAASSWCRLRSSSRSSTTPAVSSS